MPAVIDPPAADRETTDAEAAEGPPSEPREPRERAWGPQRVLLGIAVLLILALIEGAIVLAIDPEPSMRPVAIAAPPPGSSADEALLALNADEDELWVLEPRGDDDLRREETTEVQAGANLLAAGHLEDERALTLAVASSNAESVELFDYADGELSRASEIQLGTHARSLAIGELEGFEGPVLAVGTLGGRVVIFGDGPGDELRRLVVLTGLGSLPEALAIGRVDADDRADLLVGARHVLPFLSAPDGRLRKRGAQGIREAVRSLAIGDVGDGRRAFAITLGGEVQVLRWRGTSGLGVERSLDPVDSPRSLTVAELFDGRTDLAVSSGDGTIEVLELEADGGFDSVTEFEAGQSLGARIALQGLLAATLALVAFSLANPRSGALAPAAALGLRRSLRSPWAAAAIAYGAYIASAVALAVLIQPEQEDVTRELGFGESRIGDLASALLIVVAAPLSEEIFFRGFVFGGLRRAMPFVAAAAISALVWGIFHFTGPGSWGVVLQLSVFGVALAWLYERTGSIWPAIAVHAINNALAFGILTS
jgi:membrane protease YdiL (CAAX protease family)